MRQFLRYAALYVLVELAAVALLVWAFGLGSALAVLAAAFLVGAALAASQVRAQVSAVRRNPRTAAAEGALVGLGAFLVFLPGVVSTAAGALLLAPPTRGAMRPLAAGFLTRGITRRLGTFDMGTVTPVQRRDYIDGVVVDVVDGEVNLPALR